ncbi:MAG: ATP-dependent protease ATPase subunit HslU [Cystobacterineae bacterium]|nr:ATP-dependent protease ATPase subunit HslU [Cystobacterineae bacterium]
MASLTPREIVSELDRYIVGQKAAKRAVAIALRNQWRRQRVAEEFRDEIQPKNIILIGPTGVGKTEIARRLAKLSRAPFVKVEASKFTEVGYVGRDVDSMVRDLVEASIALIREEKTDHFRLKAKELAEDKLADLLSNPGKSTQPLRHFGGAMPSSPPILNEVDREKLRARLRAGTLDNEFVELEVKETQLAFMKNFSGQGMEEFGINLQDFFRNVPGMERTKKQKMSAPMALMVLEKEELSALMDQDNIQSEALSRAEKSGIIFIDEIDKIASRSTGQSTSGIDVSREGVQRDILPIIEGSTVTTKYGSLKTDHVLFIAAGAFHVAKPSDLIPELQGRFPIRVELEALSGNDLEMILREPKNSLVRQYTELLATEGIVLEFEDEAIKELALMACQANERMQNIGARRLHTIMECLLDEVSFSASEMTEKGFRVTVDYVKEKLKPLIQSEDISRYIL